MENDNIFFTNEEGEIFIKQLNIYETIFPFKNSKLKNEIPRIYWEQALNDTLEVMLESNKQKEEEEEKLQREKYEKHKRKEQRLEDRQNYFKKQENK